MIPRIYHSEQTGFEENLGIEVFDYFGKKQSIQPLLQSLLDVEGGIIFDENFDKLVMIVSSLYYGKSLCIICMYLFI